MIIFVLVLVSLIFTIERPVIGVITQPATSLQGNSSLPASYIKWLESGGAKVVPFLYDMNYTDVEYLFQRVNGFVFPGGGVNLQFGTPYMDMQKKIYEMSMKANLKGDYFPIHGTCLGFESLLILTSENDWILDFPFDSYNLSLPLNFQMQPNETRIFSFFPDSVIDIYKYQNVTLNNHHQGINPDKFTETKSLNNFYTLISTNKDRGGLEFVSTIESKNYPIYGTQWHPEKAAFEDNPEAINHSFDSVLANQYLGLFIVNEARKSYHKFDSEEEEQQYLIYNYEPYYTFPSGSEFDQMYYFPKASDVFGN